MKSLLSAASFFLLVLLGGLTLSAATEGTALQAQDHGQEIQVPAGAIIELSLPEQAGTGYRWEFDRLDAQHFEVLKTETRPLATKNPVGGPVLKTWWVKTKNAGESALTLNYLRPWEGKGQAAQHFTVKIRLH